jgi:hypothetical protein
MGTTDRAPAILGEDAHLHRSNQGNYYYVVPFLILLVLGLLAVMDFLFFKRFMVTGKSRDDNYVRMFVKYFRIFFFADFMEEIDSYDGLEVSMFAFAAIMILIILMNLLISIIGDSHEKVYSTKKSTEGFIRCRYIIGLESINVFPCCNRFDSDGFLVCAEYENQKGVEEWEGRVTEIGRKIDKQSETTKQMIEQSEDRQAKRTK